MDALFVRDLWVCALLKPIRIAAFSACQSD